jgi:hypothetical protein
LANKGKYYMTTAIAYTSGKPLSAITGGSCQYLANGSILLLQSHVPPTLGHPLSACVGFLCKSAIKVLSFSSLLSHTFLE